MDKSNVDKIEFFVPNMYMNLSLDMKEIARCKNGKNITDIITSCIEVVRKDFYKEVRESLEKQHPDAPLEAIEKAYDYIVNSMSIKVDDSNLYKPIELWKVHLDSEDEEVCFSNTDNLAYLLKAKKLVLAESKDSSVDLIADLEGNIVGKLEHSYYISNRVKFSTEYHKGNCYVYWSC